MSDPKYPIYKGTIRFDDYNILEASISQSGVDVKLNGETIGGDISKLDLFVFDATRTAALATKIKKGWFNSDPGAGASASSPAIVPGSTCDLLVFNCKLASANVLRINSSSKADTVVWLKEAPAGTPFSAASGASFAGYVVNCCFKEPTGTAPDYGLTGATFNYDMIMPDPGDVMI